MKNVLVLALSLLLAVLPLGCDDKKEEKEEPPVAGEVMAGEMLEETSCGNDEEPDMMIEEEVAGEISEAGQEEMDMEMPEAGEMEAGEMAEEEQPEG